MQGFYFIYKEDTGTVYHASLKGESYVVSWGKEEKSLRYKKREVERYLKNKVWVVINESIEAEDF